MAKGEEQRRIQTSDPGQVLGIDAVTLVLVLIDRAQPPGIGYVDFLAELNQ
jgi:hypothetical protein